MTDFDRQPGAIDDPGLRGGLEPQLDRLPPGDSAGNTGGPAEPSAAELDLPGPDDPVAWSYVQEGTEVVGPDGVRLGTVEAMLGTENEGIFHGVAVKPERGGDVRMLPADQVSGLTPSRVAIRLDADALERCEVYRPLPEPS
ncbi:MAG TPA: hypothetical protein VHK06_06455 [Candidatus Limnocylindria bacterium]|nr:hypothetical protein [Candidatus Limnocylindria bacterium]